MPEQSLKSKTVKGIAWNTVENFAGLGIQFIFGIILARLLTPEDYGILGMIAVFLAVSNMFIGGGFAPALIRKIDRTETDCSTVFYFNIVVACLFYVLLFIGAPYIADFFEQSMLTPIVRVMGLTLIIGSLAAVQDALLNARLDFKTSAKITLASNITSGIVGIILAYLGYGVWSLVYQQLLNRCLRTLLIWCLAKWRPIAAFSWASFRTLFSFGSKMLASGLINTLYNNIYPLIIGKLFTPASLGLYTRAQGYASLPSTNLTNVIQRVTFPVLSQIQDDEKRLEVNYRKLLRMSAFVIFPCMMLLFGIADPLIRWMITDKWASCVILLQIICFSMMWYPIHAINLNLLQVKGRSDLFLNLEIIKKIVGIVIICISYRWGVEGMCYGGVASSLICLVINTYYTGKLINVGFITQMRDVFPTLVISIIAGVVALLISEAQINYNFLKVIFGSISFALTYITLSYYFTPTDLNEVRRIIMRK